MISDREFSNMAVIINKITKTLKNFDDKINALEDTVTVEVPRAVAETVSAAMQTAVCSNEVNGCANPTVPNIASAEIPTTTVPSQFCGDSNGIESFSTNVTKTIEQMSNVISDISNRVDKMFVKVFSNTSEVYDIPNAADNLFNGHGFNSNDPDTKATLVVKKQINVTPEIQDMTGNFSKRYEQVKNIFNL